MATRKRYCIQYLETLEATTWKAVPGPDFDTLEEALRARAAAERAWPVARIWDTQMQRPVAAAGDAERR